MVDEADEGIFFLFYHFISGVDEDFWGLWELNQHSLVFIHLALFLQKNTENWKYICQK